MPGEYVRKISSEEAREGYILVEKSRLRFFPSVGSSFELMDDGTSSTSSVEARDCECRGPEKPHQHYFVRHSGLVAGDRVRFSLEGTGYRFERM